MEILFDHRFNEIREYLNIVVSDSVIENVDKRVEFLGEEEAFEENYKYIDCTRYSKDGTFRLMQTIGVPYKIEMCKIVYIVETYLNDRDDLVERIIQRHKSNLLFEEKNPPVKYKGKDRKPETTTKTKTPRKPRKTKEEKQQEKLSNKFAKFANLNIKI